MLDRGRCHFAARRARSPIAAVVVAVLASLMVSLHRARAEALGVECKVGIANRAVRVVILSSASSSPALGVFERRRSTCSRGLGTYHLPPADLPRPRAQLPARPCNSPRRGSSPYRESTRDSHDHERQRTNGHAPDGAGALQQDKVRVAIIGVGNCATSSSRASTTTRTPTRRRTSRASCTSTSAATTSATSSSPPPSTSTPTKVGKDLGEAIWSGQNNTIKFAKVRQDRRARPPRHDARRPRQVPQAEDHEGAGETADIVQILKDTKTDVVVSYLPVGSEDATKWYVEQVLEAGCGFVNCIPVFIAREDYWDKRFQKAGLPIVGDDIKSQVGATIVHRSLARLFHDRGVQACSTPRSSTSAATWTSSTCSSASGWSPRRSPRRTP